MSSSKTMEPNQLKTVKNQTSEFSGIEIPSEIRTVEAHLFHCVMINSTPKPPTGWKHDMKVQMFDERSWDINKKNLAQLGYSQVFVLHDPRQMAEDIKNDEGDAECSYGFMKTEAKEMGYEGSLKKVDILAYFAENDVTMESLIAKEAAEEAAGNE